MKHIKRFNESSEYLYKEVEVGLEYTTAIFKNKDKFSNNERYAIESIFEVGDDFNITYVNSPENKAVEHSVEYAKLARLDVAYLYIYKLEDSYYLLQLQANAFKLMRRDKFYLCDGLDGLEQCWSDFISPN